MPYSKTVWAKGDVIVPSKLNNIEDGLAAALNATEAPELIRDTLGTTLVPGNGIAIIVDDATDSITIATTSTPPGGANGVTIVDNQDGTFTATGASVTDNTDGTYSFTY